MSVIYKAHVYYDDGDNPVAAHGAIMDRDSLGAARRWARDQLRSPTFPAEGDGFWYVSIERGTYGPEDETGQRDWYGDPGWSEVVNWPPAPTVDPKEEA